MLGYMSDVVATLNTYHRGGLWHKDIKPENIVVHAGQAHVVDLGLVTSLRSAMTLTTHGTEYFRDPEMVRMALRGVKVHEVDGAKFDIYGAAAVLYFALEGTFPSHGGLSTITKRCPDAVKWIVRRGMTDYNQRYASADMMLRDIDAVRRHPDVWAMKPAELPSMVGENVAREPVAQPQPEFASFNPAPAAASAAGAAFASAGSYGRPQDSIANWWTGRIDSAIPTGASVKGACGLQGAREEIRRAARTVRDEVRRVVGDMRGTGQPPAAAPASEHGPDSVRINFANAPRRSAAQQVVGARARARERRREARARRHQVQHPAERINLGMVVAAVAVLGAIGLAAVATWSVRRYAPYAEATVISGPGAQVVARNGRTISLSPPGSHVTINLPGIATVMGAPRVSSSASSTIDPKLASMVSGLPHRYLIINDHPDLRSEAVRNRVAQIGAMLRGIGFEPFEDADLEATLDARIRTEVSRVCDVDIEKNNVADAERIVGSLLGADEQLADVGCVVWIARGSSNRMLTWVITPDCLNSNVDEGILGYLSADR